MQPQLPKVPPVGASTPAPAPGMARTMADMLPSDSAGVTHFRNTGTRAPAPKKTRRFWVQLDEEDAQRLERLCLERRNETGERTFNYSKACSEGLVLWLREETARRKALAAAPPLHAAGREPRR